MPRADDSPLRNTSLKKGILLSLSWKDNGSQLELGEDEQAVALRKAWEKTVRALANRGMKSSFAFVAATQPIMIDDDTLILGTPSTFAREWLEKRYGEFIRSNMMQNLGRTNLQVKFVRRNADAKTTAGEQSQLSANTASSSVNPDCAVGCSDTDELRLEPPPVKTPSRRKEIARPPLPEEMSLPLNERFTFDNVVVGDSNRLAHTGALAVASNPGKIYNPLFIYGNSGLGKTHLMHAIGHQIRKTLPKARIAHVSGESFTNSYIASLQHKKVDVFRELYRNVDVWLVDDIQTLAGKEHTKEEFFHTFNTLHQAGKQIVLTSDQSPRELRTMDERLRTRFECGLIADVNPPQLDMRFEILKRKAEIEGLTIPNDVLYYMANLIQSNIRALEGALIKITAFASMSNVPVTEQLASTVLGSYFVERRPVVSHSMFEGNDRAAGDSPLVALPLPPVIVNLDYPRAGKPLFDHVVQTVADYYHLDPHMLAGENSIIASRCRDIAPARQIAIYLAREKTSLAVTEIARLFGGISHSAVSHAHRKMAKLLETDPRRNAILQEIIRRL
jgi:chromosomal replication initiator protein